MTKCDDICQNLSEETIFLKEDDVAKSLFKLMPNMPEDLHPNAFHFVQNHGESYDNSSDNYIGWHARSTSVCL